MRLAIRAYTELVESFWFLLGTEAKGDTKSPCMAEVSTSCCGMLYEESMRISSAISDESV